MQSTYFSGFSAGLRHKNNPVAVNGILYSGGLAALFARLEFDSVDFSICNILQAKVQATPHANQAALHPFIAAE